MYHFSKRFNIWLKCFQNLSQNLICFYPQLARTATLVYGILKPVNSCQLSLRPFQHPGMWFLLCASIWILDNRQKLQHYCWEWKTLCIFTHRVFFNIVYSNEYQACDANFTIHQLINRETNKIEMSNGNFSVFKAFIRILWLKCLILTAG